MAESKSIYSKPGGYNFRKVLLRNNVSDARMKKCFSLN